METAVDYSQPTVEEVVEKIRKMITAGILKPGSKLPAERKLAEELNVSRRTLKNAIQKLEFYGLVKTLPQSGTRVQGKGIIALEGLAIDILDFEKEDLKHFDCLKGEICLNNVNDFIISDLENDISSEKKIELDAFLKEHSLESDKKYFYATKLKPNLSEVFEDKGGLKKRGTIIPFFVKMASIAAVGLLLFNFMGTNNSQYYSARTNNFVLNIDTLQHKFEFNLADNNAVETLDLKETKQNPDFKNNLPQYSDVKVDSIQPIIQNEPVFNDDVVIKEQLPAAQQIVQENGKKQVFGEAHKSTKTTVPFFKNNELEYSKALSFLGDGYEKYGWIVFIFIVVFIVTGISNGANLTDGIDGLAAGSSAIMVITLAVFSWVSGNIIFADYFE